jgi:hypothetical protein
LEAFDIAFARGEITSHNMQNADCCSLVDRAKVGFGVVGPGDLSSPSLLALAVRSKRGAAHALEISEGKAKLGEHFFMGNGRVILRAILWRLRRHESLLR